VITDPHLEGKAERKSKFETAVDWIIEKKDINDIELVFVLGDIAWGGSKEGRNLTVAKKILDRLNNVGISYIPIIGDNEVECRCEKEFQDVFDLQYRYLSKVLTNWQKAPCPVRNNYPETTASLRKRFSNGASTVNNMYLQNFSFDYKGCHFVCPDFNSRKAGVECGELHDFPGGSWLWFKNNIVSCPKAKKENIVIMTHIGMFRTGFEAADRYLFTESQMGEFKQFLQNYREYVDSNYAGHIHQNWSSVVWSGFFTPIYYVRVTDETWYDTQWPERNDHEITVRLVQVNNDGPKIIYNQHIFDIDGLK
jgi:hypothetical protein